jgi:conjugal transfer pilus assembly protein TraF
VQQLAALMQRSYRGQDSTIVQEKLVPPAVAQLREFIWVFSPISFRKSEQDEKVAPAVRQIEATIIYFVKALALSILFLSCSLDAGWHDRKAEGWAWYEDKPQKETVKESRETRETSETALERLSTIKKDLEEKLAIAVLEPSEENIEAYMEEQRKWFDQSSKFSKTWSKLLLLRPDLDPTATQFPVSQYGSQLQKRLSAEDTKNLILNLAKDNGLFFFYEGNSKVSQAFAKVIREFSKRYSWEIVPISVDGTLLEGFPDSKLDNGISNQFGITVFPALFVINPSSKTATPISYGLVSLDQIESNFTLQFKERE